MNITIFQLLTAWVGGLIAGGIPLFLYWKFIFPLYAHKAPDYEDSSSS